MNNYLCLWYCIAILLAPGIVIGQDKANNQESPPKENIPQGPPPALVRVGTVKIEPLQARTNIVGKLRQLRLASVSAEQPGRVIEVVAEEGTVVTGNTSVLVKIDDIWARISMKEAKANLAEVKASVAESEAHVDQARRDRIYLEELFEANSAKPKEVEDARSDELAELARLERSRANLLRAEAELSRCQEQLDRLTVMAPFDGIVVKTIAEPGQWVKQGDHVVEMISRGLIDGLIDVPEDLINKVTIDQNVELQIEPLNLEVSGKVAAINPLGSTVARTFPVKVRLSDRNGLLKPGMSVTALLPTGDKIDVATVPRDAIHRSEQGPAVWVDLNGAAARVPVKILFGNGDRYAIQATKGAPVQLQNQMNVVVEGAERLFPFRPLQIAHDNPN